MLVVHAITHVPHSCGSFSDIDSSSVYVIYNGHEAGRDEIEARKTRQLFCGCCCSDHKFLSERTASHG